MSSSPTLEEGTGQHRVCKRIQRFNTGELTEEQRQRRPHVGWWLRLCLLTVRLTPWSTRPQRWGAGCERSSDGSTSNVFNAHSNKGLPLQRAPTLEPPPFSQPETTRMFLLHFSDASFFSPSSGHTTFKSTDSFQEPCSAASDGHQVQSASILLSPIFY